MLPGTGESMLSHSFYLKLGIQWDTAAKMRTPLWGTGMLGGQERLLSRRTAGAKPGLENKGPMGEEGSGLPDGGARRGQASWLAWGASGNAVSGAERVL